ncbi:MAG: YciI family protein [Chloroflexi bacterium]|nr:YciI family protein [Chloroflexota bacterium]
MKYACLIYSDESGMATATQEQMQEVMGAYWKFEEEIGKAGVKLGGEALQPTMTATTVQVKNGKTLTSDGPFAETKEQLGGFYLIEAKDLDEAISWAAKIPGAWLGGRIEVRPVIDFSNMQPPQ